MRTFTFELFADYSQFYIQDESATGDLSESWTEDAVTRLLAVAPGTVGIGTVRNTNVPVTLELLEMEPADDFDAWDQVSECSLQVTFGPLVIAGCTDYFPDAARVEIEPGSYRVRVSYGSLDHLSDDGLEGDDHYRVQLWHSDPIEPRIVKCRASE